MLITEHGTMPTTRKSSITSDEYMEIRRQQNKDAQRRWREKRRLEREAGEAAKKATRKSLSPTNKVKLPPASQLTIQHQNRPRNGSSSTLESVQSPTNFTLQPISSNYSHHHYQHSLPNHPIQLPRPNLPPIQPSSSMQEIRQPQMMMNGVPPPHPAYSPAFYPSSPPSSRQGTHTTQNNNYPFDDINMGERLFSASQQIGFDITKLSWSELIVLACYQNPNQPSSSTRTNELALQSMHFAKAFIENARCLGMDIGYACDPSSLSIIPRDWQAFQNEQHHHSFARRRSTITGDGVNDTVHRRRAGSNTSSSSSNSSSFPSTNQRMYMNGNSNGNGPFPNGTTLPALHPPPTSAGGNEDFSSRLNWDKVPFTMHPTESQLRVDHHPFLDIAFPWPSMREKILTMLANSIIDEVELIDDCFQTGLPGSKQKQPAFSIWGNDPLDPFSWEIGEIFAQKWWFLLDEEIIHRSNWWRKQRSLPPLRRGDRK